MYDHFSNLGRYVSILDRLMKMYYDRGLADYEIGWGQQFYVEYIYDHPGATPQEMAQCIRVAVDERDRRMKHLYLTEKALPAAEQIKKIHGAFFEDLQAGISGENLTVTENTLHRMADNINKKVWHRMEEHHGK